MSRTSDPADGTQFAAIAESARTTGIPSVRLIAGSAGRSEVAHFVIAWPSSAPMLSDVVPIFERLGFRVAKHRPVDVEGLVLGAAVDEFHAHCEPTYFNADLARLVEDAFLATWAGATEQDGLSRLVIKAQLSWREVALLRAAVAYLPQAGLRFSAPYVAETLVRHPHYARQLIAFFTSRHHPAQGPEGESTETLEADLTAFLDRLDTLDEDRILRALRQFFLAVLRTNYFQSSDNGGPKDYFSFKLDPSQLPFLPQPRPLIETYVYSPLVVGLHLRGGLVARGGLRWSDRPEDFRTEVLGLMKAQMVKNAVIVPSGAKGAFIVKKHVPGLDRESAAQLGRDAYAMFIRGLLDVTDNMVDGVLTHPTDMVVHDGPDPYLVVAADKGTTTFSDLANSIAEEYDFWLGDAFAAGGSAGYDHKGVGITARGAWVSVRQHFNDLGLDTDRDEFTAAGVGDMSGDVFGNGMLLSRHIKLVAAFDHRHIFLDPDPDPETSYGERSRLFGLVGSSWSDYDRAKLSTGGGIHSRTAKEIPVTPEVRNALGIDERTTSLSPNETIKAILTSPVDLVWNGGVGTYVKASDETDAHVADPANDTVRVDAAHLRCRVIGEGGNLGLTQRARIEYALAGGRINTDFIDNSAGVDTSDHEVNLKILLSLAVKDGTLTESERDGVLAEVTEDVARAVLDNNRAQVQAISTAEEQASFLLDRHTRVIQNLEEAAGLDRHAEHLPDESEIAERRAGGAGLSRPEIAVLLAYSKNLVREELLDSDIPEDPFLSRMLNGYFPAKIRLRFEALISVHPLARDIIATQLANDLINHVGPGFLYRLEERTGCGTAHAMRGFAIGREVLALDELWDALERTGDQVSAATRQRVLSETHHLLEQSAAWLVRRRRLALDVDQEVSRFLEPAREVMRLLETSLDGAARDRYAREYEQLLQEGLDVNLARRVAALALRATVFDLAEAASTSSQEFSYVAAVHFRLGAALGFDWLRDQIIDRPSDNHWTLMAKATLRDDLDLEQQHVLVAVLQSSQDPDPDQIVNHWISLHDTRVKRCLAIVSDLREYQPLDVAMLTVALQPLRELAQTVG